MVLIIPRKFYSRHPVPVARDLLGKLLVRKIDDCILAGVITDTEAYGPPEEDPLVRTEGVRGLRQGWFPGLAWTTYVMRGRSTLNVTTEPPSCVLIRAIEPKLGLERTSHKSQARLTVGPINLAKALRIDRALDKADITASGSLFVFQGASIAPISTGESGRKNVKIDTEEP